VEEEKKKKKKKAPAFGIRKVDRAGFAARGGDGGFRWD